MASDDKIPVPEQSEYQVVQTKTMLVKAANANEAGRTAELIFALAPGNKAVTTTIKTEKVR